MENLKKSTFAKVIAVILTAVLTTVCLFSTAGLVFGVAADLYSTGDSGNVQIEDIFDSELYTAAGRIIYSINFKDEYFPNISDNLMYEIRDTEGKVIYSDIDKNNVMCSVEETYMIRLDGEYTVDDIEGTTEPEFDEDEYAENEDTVDETEETSTLKDENDEYEENRVPYTIKLCLKKDIKAKDNFYYMSKIFTYIQDNEASLIAQSVLSFVFSVVLYAFLMCASGHRKNEEGIYVSLFDKIPFDLLSAAVIGIGTGIVLLTCMIIDEIQRSYPFNYNTSVLPFVIAYFALLGIVFSVLITVWSMTTAVRIKSRTLVKSTLIYKLLSFVWKYTKKIICTVLRVFKRIFGFFGHAIAQIPTLWKSVFVIAAGLALSFILLIISFDCDTPLLLSVYFVLLSIAAFLVCVMFSDIKKGTEKIANGSTEEKINTKRLFGDLKRHGDNINSINDGIAKAVDEKMKSERFKTELITNVSHDIKTPLTSIINYVDLLSKEEIGNENSDEYIEVLTRQSSKLKKLIDDLLEASKASTGNLAVNFTTVEMGIALSQTLGEYEDRFAAKSLEAIMSTPKEPLCISADNRHMWRIFDNLFNNIAKYAQPGTRVYIDAVNRGGIAEVTFKNISSEPLNISGEELTERFVRGDSSRNTEGSGLGLSIARSLTELQKGRFDVQIDGDLFKVTIKFPIIK